MGNNQKIVLLALQFQDDGFQTDSQIMVRLPIDTLVYVHSYNKLSICLPRHEDSDGDTGQAHACALLQDIGP